ncbi:MAG: hypothetical protein U0T75_14710 [Chitinophagales bacterium]
MRKYLSIGTFVVMLFIASCSNNGAHNHNPVPDVSEQSGGVDSAVAPHPEENVAPAPETLTAGEAKDQASTSPVTQGEKSPTADTKDKAH